MLRQITLPNICTDTHQLRFFFKEVNEELDAQQRVKIESDRFATEQLNKKIVEFEKKFTEKEYTVPPRVVYYYSNQLKFDIFGIDN